MASLLDQLYFSRNPWGEEQSNGLLGNLGMFASNTGAPPSQFTGGFNQPQLPPNAQPTAAPAGPPMNIMPPAQLQSMQPQAPQQPGFMDRLGDAIAANPTMLMALGAGTMQGGLGKGLHNAAQYSILDKQAQEQAFRNNQVRQQQASTLQFMKSRGVSDQDAMLLLAQPEALKTWLAQNSPVQRPNELVNIKVGNGQEITQERTPQGQILPINNTSLQNVPPKLDDVTNLQKAFTALPAYKAYSEAAPVYKSMLETAPRDNQASDANLAYGLAQIMSPGSVVRSENGTWAANNIAGLPDWLKGAINGLTGGARLGPDVRTRIMEEAHNRMSVYHGALVPEVNRIGNMAKRYNIPVEDVITPLEPPQRYSPPASPPPPNQATQNAPVIKWGRDKDGKPVKL